MNMELVLLAITIVSLIVAFVMSAAAWRLSREERARSGARVAALAAAAASESESHARSTAKPYAVAEPISRSVEPAARPATVVETPTEPLVVGERTVRAAAAAPAAPWSAARVSAFAPSRPAARSSESARTPDLILRDTPTGEVLIRETTPLGQSFLGSSVTARPSDDRQKGLAIAAAILFVAVAGGGYWTVFGKTATATAATAAAETAPLELISLRHERAGGRLAVTGLIHNPIGGMALEKLTAVVFLFDQQGNFITSARANVDFTRLAPGDESPFVINVDAPANVARYRVSFRNDAGIVSHIDRRGQAPIGASVGS